MSANSTLQPAKAKEDLGIPSHYLAIGILLLTSLVFMVVQNSTPTVGGHISLPKALWLDWTLTTFYTVPFFLWRNPTLSPPIRSLFGWLLLSFVLRGIAELVVIYATHAWKCIDGISHNGLTLILAAFLFFRLHRNLSPTDCRALGYLLIYVATLIFESINAWQFSLLANPASGVYFAADTPHFAFVNRLTWLETGLPVALVLLAFMDNPSRFFPPMNTRRLTSQVLPVRELDTDFALKLYHLFAACYDNVNLTRFESDLAEKDFIVVLRDTKTGEPRGFSTQQIIRLTVEGSPIRALFSGDTIIDPDYWGEQELVRGWCQVAGRALAEEPEAPLYWLLISKGYRTYLYLPVFYHEFWPRHDRATPPSMQAILDALAGHKWPHCYRASSGLLHFPSSLGNLRSEIADVPEARLTDPNVHFFLERNPSYLQGTELVCLAPISLENTKSIGRRLIQQAVREYQARRADRLEVHHV